MAEVGTAIAVSAAKATTPALIRLLSNVGRKRYDAILAKYALIFNDHVETVRRKVSIVKNLIYKDQPAGILTQYVSVNFSLGENSITDREVSNRIRSPVRYIISGTGGAGKSMFMKWCTLDLINSMENHQLIPLFLELRDITEENISEDLTDVVFKLTSTKSNKASYAQFLEGLKAGVFTIILDAVDEVSPELREKVVSSIRTVARDYPNTPIMISTRPDERLESTSEFEVIRTMPMTLLQVQEVIGKLEYDHEVKSKLIQELANGLYKKHKSFLSNPLLATIMLLTFDQSAEIPNKVTLFYKQAFEALYQRHDAHKGGVYKRGHYARLPLDEFERVFSAFCYITYINGKIEFSDSRLTSFFREALSFCGMKVDAPLVVKDATESVCLIQKDGLDNVFVHRSFQEYFCAMFLSTYRGSSAFEVIDRAFNRSNNDNVISMLNEIDEPLLNTSYALPLLEGWISNVARLKLDTPSGLHKFMSHTFGQFEIDPKEGKITSYRVVKGKACYFCTKLEQIYEKASLHAIFFHHSSPKLVPNFKRFISSIEISSPVLKILKAGGFKEDQRVPIEVTLTEAKWLVQTNLPKRLSEIRAQLMSLRDDIRSKVDERNAFISNLLLN